MLEKMQRPSGHWFLVDRNKLTAECTRPDATDDHFYCMVVTGVWTEEVADMVIAMEQTLYEIRDDGHGTFYEENACGLDSCGCAGKMADETLELMAKIVRPHTPGEDYDIDDIDLGSV